MSDDHQSENGILGLLTSHRKWLRSVIVARLGGSEGADDVLQEVHLAAVEQKSPVREPSAIRSWLFQIAVRQSMLFRRRTGRYRKLLDKVPTQSREADETHDPLTWLLSSERRQLVQQAMTRLDGHQRELLILKYVEGWSYRQIAEHRGSTERAAESKVHRARGRLRQILTQLNVSENKDQAGET